jgi:hypothetical protein
MSTESDGPHDTEQESAPVSPENGKAPPRPAPRCSFPSSERHSFPPAEARQVETKVEEGEGASQTLQVGDTKSTGNYSNSQNPSGFLIKVILYCSSGTLFIIYYSFNSTLLLTFLLSV